MKVKFIQTVSTDRQCFIRGREYDVTDAEGNSYVKAKLAAAVAPEAAPKPETKKTAAPKAEAK